MFKEDSLKARMKILDSPHTFPIEMNNYKLTKKNVSQKLDLMRTLILHVVGGRQFKGREGGKEEKLSKHQWTQEKPKNYFEPVLLFHCS